MTQQDILEQKTLLNADAIANLINQWLDSPDIDVKITTKLDNLQIALESISTPDPDSVVPSRKILVRYFAGTKSS